MSRIKNKEKGFDMRKKKCAMIIPSYWRREEAIGIKDTDITYDHPTPLDQDGTLLRAIESIKILNNRDFSLFVIAIANAEDIETRAEQKVLNILSNSEAGVPLYFFSHSHLRKLLSMLQNKIEKDLLYLLSLRGYSNIRNMCLFLAHILGSDIAILIDDDEVFEDPFFIEKAVEFIGEEVKDLGFVGAVAGYYLQQDGSWRLKPKEDRWATYWNSVEKMNEAFNIFIGQGPRLKETPFAFGGNMVIHKRIFQEIPFDPGITRGEDIDFLINMRMFNHKCYIDNTLYIKHLPPPKPHPIWKQMREDIYRFIFEREKLRKQRKIKGMHYVTPEELDPYPGAFLRDDLEEKIYKASHALAEHYKAMGMEKDAIEALKNIEIANKSALIRKDPFVNLLNIKNDWEKLLKITGDKYIKEEIRDSLEEVKS